MKNYRFAVYEHRVVYDNNILTRQFIVLKDDYGDIILWTTFHKYAVTHKKSIVRSIYSDTGKRCYNVVKFLNYVFIDKKSVRKLVDITAEDVRQFLQDYGLCKLTGDTEATHRSEETVELCVKHILDFLENFLRDNANCQLKINDLFRTENVFSKKKKRFIEKRVPNFTVYFKPFPKTILRDIPEGAFQIIINEVIENHKNILMLVALGAFAGMRPSECCNVRREDSILGPGILFKKANGDILDVIIDLREEKNLRSDLINVGKIKKERMQKVYPAFLEAFISCYNIYMQYIAGRPYEAEYGALTTTSNGKAYTYNAYLAEFKNVVKYCIPIMLRSDDQRTVNYGLLLQEHNITPHIFRHWFSVKLVLYGEDVAGLMNWRGDKSPESALTYLMNKSELEKEYETVNDEFINYALWKSEKLFGNKR